MRAIPLSVEGERTLSTVLRGPVLSGNLCRSGRGSAAGLSIKHSCCACETTHPRPAPFSVLRRCLNLSHDSVYLCVIRLNCLVVVVFLFFFSRLRLERMG